MDAIQDTKNHIALVSRLLLACALALEERAKSHDASKLESPEKEMYEIWRPKLDAMSIDSPEYKNALIYMGEGLQHHYAVNRHHPEHFEQGIHGMNLIDILEMVCDWKAAAARKGEVVNLEWACKRFGFVAGDQLYCVIKNTLEELN